MSGTSTGREKITITYIPQASTSAIYALTETVLIRVRLMLSHSL